MSTLEIPPYSLSYERSMLATSTTTTAGGVWWFFQQIIDHGPSWSLVPPLIFGSAAMVSAVCTAMKMSQEKRHKEELHAIAVMAARRGLTTTTADASQ